VDWNYYNLYERDSNLTAFLETVALGNSQVKGEKMLTSSDSFHIVGIK